MRSQLEDELAREWWFVEGCRSSDLRILNHPKLQQPNTQYPQTRHPRRGQNWGPELQAATASRAWRRALEQLKEAGSQREAKLSCWSVLHCTTSADRKASQQVAVAAVAFMFPDSSPLSGN